METVAASLIDKKRASIFVVDENKTQHKQYVESYTDNTNFNVCLDLNKLKI